VWLCICWWQKTIWQKQWSNSDETVMEQSCHSAGIVMPSIWAFPCQLQAFEMSLTIFYSFAMPWECVWWHKTFWQKRWSNSDETVMQQWLNSDAFDLSFVIIFSRFWDAKNSDQTVMRQGCNSDAFDLSFLILFARFFDVMDHILSFNNALEVWLLIWWWNKTI
jgi:hypothetical protein